MPNAWQSWSQLVVTFNSLDETLVMRLLKCGLLKVKAFLLLFFMLWNQCNFNFYSVKRQRPETIQMNSRSGEAIGSPGRSGWLFFTKFWVFNFGKLIWIKMLRNCKVQWTYRVGILCVFTRREQCKCHLHGFVNVPGLEEVIQFSLSSHHTRSIRWRNLLR